MTKTLVSDPVWVPPKFLPWNFFPFFPLLVVRQCSKVSSYAIYRKTNGPKVKKEPKKNNFGPDFCSFGPNLGHQFFLQVIHLLVIRHCCKLSNNAIIKENYWAKLEKIKKKTNFGPNFGLFGQIWAHKFFLEVLPLLVVRHCSNLSSNSI